MSAPVLAVPAAPIVPPPAAEGVKPKATKIRKRNYRSYNSQLRSILKDIVKTSPATLDKEGKAEVREAGFDVEALSILNCMLKDLTIRAANWQREGLTNMQSGGNPKKTLQPTEVYMAYRMLLPTSLWIATFASAEAAVKRFQAYRAEQAKLKGPSVPAGGASASAPVKGRGKRKATPAETKVLVQ